MNDRQLLSDLRALRAVKAPPTLLEDVLHEVGLGDLYAPLNTPLGPVFVAWNRLGVSAVMNTQTSEEFEASFEQRFHRRPHPARELPSDCGQRFDLRSVTEFERAVLLKAREIPPGEVRTYGWIAAQIGRPAAVRAVGSALRKNPVPVLIPCHRVVRGDGRIGQYALGGSGNKVAILAAEGVAKGELARLTRGTVAAHA
jgi:methylated-DNA-[protein]-cysteine S-methyltransferase